MISGENVKSKDKSDLQLKRVSRPTTTTITTRFITNCENNTSIRECSYGRTKRCLNMSFTKQFTFGS